jgi:hypothetical protein
VPLDCLKELHGVRREMGTGTGVIENVHSILADVFPPHVDQGAITVSSCSGVVVGVRLTMCPCSEHPQLGWGR